MPDMNKYEVALELTRLAVEKGKLLSNAQGNTPAKGISTVEDVAGVYAGFLRTVESGQGEAFFIS